MPWCLCAFCLHSSLVRKTAQVENVADSKCVWRVAEAGACVSQGKLGGCTVISCDVSLNYTTYYLSLGAPQRPRETNTVDLLSIWERKSAMLILMRLPFCSKRFKNKLFKPYLLSAGWFKTRPWIVGVKATQTDTYRYKLVWTVTTSSDLRVCVSRQVSSRRKTSSEVVHRLPLFHYKR